MATTSIIGFCPRCKNEILPNNNLDYCPHCGYSLTRPHSPHFKAPNYLFYQLDLHRATLAPERRGGGKPPSKEELARLEEVERDHKQWLIDMHAEDRICALNDALAALKFVTSSKTFGDDLKRVIDAGKKIGALATAIEDYLKHGGGLLHARKIGPIPSDDGNTFSSSATAR